MIINNYAYKMKNKIKCDNIFTKMTFTVPRDTVETWRDSTTHYNIS